MNGQNLLIIGIIVAMTIAILLLANYLKNACKSMNQLPSISCPGMNDQRYKNTPEGMCLLDCDQQSDQCYLTCGSNDDCIRHCYHKKSQCYMNCLTNKEAFVIESEIRNAECGSCQMA